MLDAMPRYFFIVAYLDREIDDRTPIAAITKTGDALPILINCPMNLRGWVRSSEIGKQLYAAGCPRLES